MPLTKEAMMGHLSIIIPVHNEQNNILPVAEEIERAFCSVKFCWEVIWVNDGSSDDTKEVLTSYSIANQRHKVITFQEKQGQSSAILNGIQYAKYPLIATLDGDGQNYPFDLLILKQFLEDTDCYLAQGVRLNRHDQNIRLISTKLANGFRRMILGDIFCDVGCPVRVFRKDIITGLPAFHGWHRFLPVMLSFLYPDKVFEHPVNHRTRLAGSSKYGVWDRLWVGLFDLVGMIWFRKRMIKIFSSGEAAWKGSFMPSASLDSSFSPGEYSSSGLPVSEQIRQ